jgi:hypothetical protein
VAAARQARTVDATKANERDMGPAPLILQERQPSRNADRNAVNADRYPVNADRYAVNADRYAVMRRTVQKSDARVPSVT